MRAPVLVPEDRKDQATASLNEAERARRAEFVREASAAALNGELPEQRTQKREKKADAWSRWFRERMDHSGSTDPAELLPEAFARLEQLNEDAVAAAVREFKAALRKALA
jgi:hypothetical protein